MQTQPKCSTSTKQGILSGASWIASGHPTAQKAFLDSLEDGELAALEWMFEFWAFEHQVPPQGDWRTWMIMGGRGAGKTRAGAEWIRTQVEGSKAADSGRCKRIALVAETYDQARDVMVFGDSGILACSPPDRRPTWIATKRMLEWPNGATAQVFSARDPDALRGPQFDCAWVDELAKWPNADRAWDMLQFGLRLGDHPQQLVTTTPQSIDLIHQIKDNPTSVVTQAPTEANRANLAESFLSDVRARYANSRLGRQELDGVLLSNVEGALWKTAMFKHTPAPAEFDRVLVAVDPPVTFTDRSDLCGISVVGIVQNGAPHDWTAHVLADRSFRPSSAADWARAAVNAAEHYDAQTIIAEVNQGGDMVIDTLRAIDPTVPIHKVHASKSKSNRASSVAVMYEQGKISHASGLADLEDQLCQMTGTGFKGSGSPDRVDALVWAITVGIVDPARSSKRPSVRGLYR
ncbi:MAG: DNA-packaging protein [Planktomarina sp.]